MRCILFRHGIAVDREEWRGHECDRPLTNGGYKKTCQAVEGLAVVSPGITHILSSPFVRALENAQIIKDVLGLKEKVQTCQALVYDHAPLQMFPILTKFPDESYLICVGHEPHLGQLAGLMIAGKCLPGLSLKKAGACAIQFQVRPIIGAGLLEWWLKPGQLRRLSRS